VSNLFKDIMTDYNEYKIYSSWGEDNENKGTALWKAPSASEAGEKHRKAFPAEHIDLISKCDEDHPDSFSELVGWAN